MAVIFENITDLLVSRISSDKVLYGCQPFVNLSHWVCLNREIEEWMDMNMKRKSGIKVKYFTSNPDIWEEKPRSLISFENENDAVLFKMRWL